MSNRNESTTRLFFPAMVQVREFGDAVFNSLIYRTIKQMQSDASVVNAGTVRDVATIGGYQPDIALHQHLADDPAWKEFLSKIIHPSVQRYMAEHCRIAGWPAAGCGYSFAASWAVLYPKGAYQAPHIHREIFCVCAYYARSPSRPPPEGAICFINPHLESIFPLGQSWQYQQCIQPKNGTLVIFPGWLQHYSHPHFSEHDERLLITFDVKLLGK